MDEMLLKLELERLRKEINFHNHRYHVLDEPLISDYEYDQLVIRLKQIEAEHPEWITPDSPTQRVGAVVSEKFVKVRHPGSVLSLASAFDAEGVKAWIERISKLDKRVETTEFVIEPKIDGLTVVLHYHHGKFVQGATRGDGEIGEDITANLRTVRALPLTIPVDPQGPIPPPNLVVRGEVFIFLKDFEKLNEKLEGMGEKTFQNPRNTAAGSLRQLDPALTASRPLTLYTYAIVTSDGLVPSSQWETLKYLKALGFPVSDLVEYRPGIEQMLKACDSWLKRRDTLTFEADGIVIKINDLQLASDLGVVGKDPRGALALKFMAREVTTILRDIGVNVGRTGVLTPFAILEPVEIGGVIVKQATLHNFDYIAEKDIRIGDRVMLKRAGDVIPYVIGPVVEMRKENIIVYSPPKVCPTCGQMVEHFDGEVAWYCGNLSCPAQLVRNVEHFVSRAAMDVIGTGIKIVEQLIAEGLVRNVADLYKLKKDDLLKLGGFAEKKADNLLEAIAASRKQALSRLIFAMGIRGVGEVMAGDLAKFYRDLDELGRASMVDLQRIEGIGPNIARAIVDWFGREANKQLVNELKANGVFPLGKAEVALSQGKLRGMTFVITGTLPTLSREEAKDLIQQNGGKVIDSVSKNTTYLLLGEAAGSKLEKAQQLGISTLSEADLRKMLGM
jgi:DNA ligase (NAD+)